MDAEHHIFTHSMMVPAPPGLQAWVIWDAGKVDGYHYDGPHKVGAILCGNAEVLSEATFVSGDSAGKYRLLRCGAERDGRYFHNDEKWQFAGVAFLLLPDDCADWDSTIIPSDRIAFSEEGAKAATKVKNDDRERIQRD